MIKIGRELDQDREKPWQRVYGIFNVRHGIHSPWATDSAKLKMLQDIGTPDRAEKWLRDELKSDRRLMGFGHRVYRTTDPRAEILREIAEQTAPANLTELAKKVELTGIRILQEYRRERRLYANVEFYSAVVMHSVASLQIFSQLHSQQAVRSDGRRIS